MLLLIDISLPRNTESAVGEIDNVLLHDMNDLGKIVDQNLSRRKKQVPAVQRIVMDEVQSFFRKRASIDAGPLIRELRESFHAVREQELQRHLRRFREEDRELVERVTRDLVQKLLHHPTVEIRSVARHPELNRERLFWVRRLFGLNHSDGGTRRA